MFCSKCGKELPNGSKFCPDCGNKIDGTKAISIDTDEISRKFSVASEKGVKIASGLASQAKVKSGELVKKARESDSTKRIVEKTESLGQKISYRFLAVSIAQAFVLFLCTRVIIVVKSEYHLSEETSLFDELGADNSLILVVLTIALIVSAIACSVVKTIKCDIRLKPVPVICIAANAWTLFWVLFTRFSYIPAVANKMLTVIPNGENYARVIKSHLTFAGFLLFIILIGLIVFWVLQIKNEKKEGA